MPATFTNLLPATKSDPKGRTSYEFEPSADEFGPRAGFLTIRQPREYTTYTVSEFAVDWDGRGFHLKKLTTGTDPSEEAYSCFVARNGQDRRCECKGFERWANCKHLAALIDLIQNGKL
jgi:hypothetical protein